MQPAEYLEVGDVDYAEAARNLEVQVVSKDNFLGPTCPVELVLLPRVIPGLLPIKTAGAYKQFLTAPKQKATLKAENLQFQTATPPRGRIYLSADGYNRAFMYRTSFTGGAPIPLSDNRPRLRLLAPRYAVPGAKYEVEVHVDAAPPAGPYVIELGLDRTGEKTQFNAPRLLPGHRDQRVQVSPGSP